MKLAEEFGTAVARAWEREDYDMNAFPALAAAALEESDVSRIGISDLLENVASSAGLPFQEHFDSDFGQPPVTLFWHPRFYVVALFWTTSTTSIHDHGFAGAYTILEGSSLQSVFSFDEREALAEEVIRGSLTLEHVEWISRGRVVPIVPGRSFIHSAFHLESPSVTLVIRTHSRRPVHNQYQYYSPMLAVATREMDQHTARRLQCLEMLAATDQTRYTSFACRVLEHADFLTCFKILIHAGKVRDAAVRPMLMGVARRRFGARMDAVDAVLAEGAKHRVVIAGRRRIAEVGPRLLLGLLLAAPDRSVIESCVSQRVGKDEVQGTIARWTLSLLRSGLFGIKAANSYEEGSVRAALFGGDDVPASGSALRAAMRSEALFQPFFRPTT